MIEKSRIKAMALSSGFKLKEQPNGEMDLNPYVYSPPHRRLRKPKLGNKILSQK